MRFLPSLGAGFTSIFIAWSVRCPQWPNLWWEWVLLVLTALMGIGLIFSAYLTHKDYSLIWNANTKVLEPKLGAAKGSNQSKS